MTTKNYFSDQERRCRCGCGMDVDPAFLKKLNQLRELVGPLIPTSMARCPIHNVKVGGAASSKHVLGIAADLAAKDASAKYKIIEAAIKLGFNGIGVHKDFIHVDTRTGPGVIWLY